MEVGSSTDVTSEQGLQECIERIIGRSQGWRLCDIEFVVHKRYCEREQLGQYGAASITLIYAAVMRLMGKHAHSNDVLRVMFDAKTIPTLDECTEQLELEHLRIMIEAQMYMHCDLITCAQMRYNEA